MTLPYPDSPNADENIGESIERIKENFSSLETAIGAAQFQAIVSRSVDIAARTSGVLQINDVTFQPKGMLIFANYQGQIMESWGFGSGTTTSVDCGCVDIGETGYGHSSETKVAFLFQAASTYAAASVSTWLSNGVALKWSTNAASPPSSAKYMDILYIFF